MYIFGVAVEENNMKRRKYIINLLFTLLLIVVMIYLFFPQLYIKMVSDDLKKLESAIVTVNYSPNGQNSCVIEFTEKDQLNKLYTMIKNTNKIRINRYPRHSVVTSADRHYEIQLFYSNGKVDRFGTPENPQLVYRILENDDNGYIIGQNNDLLEYVLYLANNNQ